MSRAKRRVFKARAAAGWSTSILPTEVRADDILAESDAREYRSQATQQELRLAQRKAKIRHLENQLALARDTSPIQIRLVEARIDRASSDLAFAEKELERH